MPRKEDAILKALRSFQATISKLTTEATGVNQDRKRPRQEITPERKRRKRSDRSRHYESQQRRRQVRMDVIN